MPKSLASRKPRRPRRRLRHPRYFIFLIIAAICALHPSNTSFAQVTVKDILAGFRQNRLQFVDAGFRVRIKRIESINQHVYAGHMLSRLSTELSQPGTSSQRRDELSRKIEKGRLAIEEISDDQRITSHNCQFWVKGAELQCQVAKLSMDDSDSEFSDDPASSANLTTLYSNANIRWFSGNPADGVFCWQGRSQNGVHDATVIRPSEMQNDDCRFPPFIDGEYWPVSQLHAIDRFFDGPDEAYEIRNSPIDESTSIVIIERKSQLAPESFMGRAEVREKWGHRMIGFRVQTAWVDLSRGCLPIQIEWANRWTLDGVSWDGGADFSKATRRMRDVQITHVEGLGFYPESGVIENMVRDPSFDGPIVSMYSVFSINGEPAPDIPLVVLDTTSWKCSQPRRLQPDVQLASVSFPDGTAYLDTRAGTTIYVGDESELLEPLETKPPTHDPPALMPQTKSFSTSRIILFGLSLAVLLIMACWLLWYANYSNRHKR